jgi:hypothetical protein
MRLSGNTVFIVELMNLYLQCIEFVVYILTHDSRTKPGENMNP